MRNRTRHGWHRYINGVSISTFLILVFVLLPLYWMLATSFKTTANVGASPPSSSPALPQEKTTRLLSATTPSAVTSLIPP